jgi:hypothetical protein
MKSYSCETCGRQLTDSESIARGFGPDCAARRASFLASVGVSETELTVLESSCEASARWIRNFRQDLRAGRVRQARQCIDAARRKAADALPVAPVMVEVIAAPAPASAPVVVATALTASEPPEPAIVVRPSDRGYRVHPPYRHPQFVAAFKRTVSGRWYAESAEWFIPATCLDWAIELLEHWFSMPVFVDNATHQ